MKNPHRFTFTASAFTHRNRILLAALLAALVVSVAAMTSRSSATAVSAAPGPVVAASGFTLTSPAAGALVPCGQPITVTWTGGSPSDNVNLTLIDVQAFQVFQGFGVEPNTGSRVVTIGPGSCGRKSQFYVEDSPRTTWTYGPVFNVASAPVNIADGDVAGLIAAINNANATCSPATTINLAPGGTYTLTAVAENPSEYNAPLAVGLPVIRVSMTINGNGATIQRSTEPGTPDFTVISVSGRTAGGPPSCYAYPVLTLNQIIITGGSGGGLHMNSGNAVVQDSTITQNTGAGGISNACGSLTLLNSTVSYNSSDSAYGGGGVFFWGFSCAPDKPTADISFSTIYENSNPGWGRGNAIGTAFAQPGSVRLKNSILASPSHPSEAVCNSGNNILVSLGHNILGDATDVFGSRCYEALTAPGDMINTNPLLGPLANNGGPTPTHMPLCNSPAIDAVPVADSTDVNGVPITTDQRGVNRPQGAASDIGAVEASHSQTVTIPSTAGPWDASLNPAFDYGVHDNTAPAVIDASSGIAFTAGSSLNVSYSGGLVQAGAGYPFNDANGLAGYVTNHYTGGNSNFPALYMNPGPDVLSMELVGTFANNGVIVGRPFPIGNGPTSLTVPAGASQLLLGINDNRYGDNSGSFTVAVNVPDNTPPIVSCPSPTTASADSNCQARVPNILAGVTASGGCGGPVTLSQSPAAGTLVGLGTTTITVTATDAANNSSTCTTTFTVTDSTPPIVSCPASSTASADGNCQARVPNVLAGVAASDCGGPVTLSQSPAAGTLVSLGTTTITVTATDAAHNASTCTTSFTVSDNTPPLFAGDPTVDKPVLWSPDHKMVDVTVNYAANDACSAAVCTLSVTSNEPVNGTGDGDMAPDWEIVDAHHVRLRAERAGTGTGRIYTITITCTDTAGNSSSRTVTVNVPKSQK
jgi:hypothetical protein